MNWSRTQTGVASASPKEPGASSVLARGQSLEMWLWLFLALHIPLAIALKQVAGLSTVHAWLTLVVGLGLALRPAPLAGAACAAAYVAGAEVCWRMTKAGVFWEYGKYGACLILVVSLLRSAWPRRPIWPWLYLGALVPAAVKTFLDFPFSEARDMVSFDLSGPFSLAVCTVFGSQVRLSREQLLRILLVFLAPVFALSTLLIAGLADGRVTFGSSSNFAASGGFGPNQVSALLGMGAVSCLLLTTAGRLQLSWKMLSVAMLVLFCAQSALTFSRCGLYYAGATMAASGFCFMRSPRAAMRFGLVVAVTVAVSYFAVFPALQRFTGDKLAERFGNTELTGRLELIEADLRIWSEHPFLGVGVGQALAYRTRYYAEISHTEYTRLLAEHGLLGLVALALLLTMPLRRLLQAQNPWERALAVAGVGYGLAFMSGNAMRLFLPAFTYGLAFMRERPRRARQRAPKSAQVPSLRIQPRLSPEPEVLARRPLEPPSPHGLG
jgi:hypothetical protein